MNIMAKLQGTVKQVNLLKLPYILTLSYLFQRLAETVTDLSWPELLIKLSCSLDLLIDKR